MTSDFTFHFHARLSAQTLSDLLTIHQVCMEQYTSPVSSGLDDADEPADTCLIVRENATRKPCAYAAVFELDDTALVYAFVHPDFRRQGLFTNIIARLKKRYPDLRLDFSADENAPAVRHMLHTQHFICQEKQLLLTYPLEQRPSSEHTDISVMPTKDSFLLYSLHEKIFTDFKSEAARIMFIDQMISLEGIQPYVFTTPHVFSEARPFSFGMGFLLREQNTACLCSFGILPSFQNKGYGRACLQLICHMLTDEPDITQLQVQVDAANTAAVSLYKNFGFQESDIFATYTYVRQ